MHFTHTSDFHLTLLLQILSEHYGLTKEAFDRKIKNPTLFIYSRAIISHILLKNAKYSQSKIARIFGKDHSTINYYCKIHKNNLTKGFGYKEMYEHVLALYATRTAKLANQVCHPCTYFSPFEGGCAG